jgi:phage-related protein (TIGR01555 family)
MGEFQRVDFMRVVDRRFVNPIWASADATGMPQIYRVTPMTAPQQYADVHVSRLVRFGGARTEARMKRWLNGWDFSVLQRPYDALRGNGAMWQSVETMMSEATQSVFKMKGLFAKMASTLRTEILDRISVMDQTRSTSRAIVLDAEGEEFERSSLAFAGVADVSDRGIKRVAAAAEIPVTVLLGESPAGLNATGDSDLRWFLMRVAARRQFDCEPQLRRLLGILLRARSSPIAAQVVGGWRPKIGWPPLWTPNAVELSTIKLQTAQRDQLYITEGVFEPEEVALTRGGPSGFAGDVALSDDAIAAREDLLATTLANFSEPTPVPNVPGQAPPPPLPGHTATVAPNSPVAPDAPPKAVP